MISAASADLAVHWQRRSNKTSLGELRHCAPSRKLLFLCPLSVLALSCSCPSSLVSLFLTFGSLSLSVSFSLTSLFVSHLSVLLYVLLLSVSHLQASPFFCSLSLFIAYIYIYIFICFSLSLSLLPLSHWLYVCSVSVPETIFHFSLCLSVASQSITFLSIYHLSLPLTSLSLSHLSLSLSHLSLSLSLLSLSITSISLSLCHQFLAFLSLHLSLEREDSDHGPSFGGCGVGVDEGAVTKAHRAASHSPEPSSARLKVERKKKRHCKTGELKTVFS